jgi:hypothetical protein
MGGRKNGELIILQRRLARGARLLSSKSHEKKFSSRIAHERNITEETL